MSDSSAQRYNHVLKVIDEHLVPDTIAKASRGEVFTPPELVQEMLFGLRKDKLKEGLSVIWGINSEGNFFDDDEDNRIGGFDTKTVWQNPDLTWLDPANGIGNFPLIAFYKLDYELSKLDAFKEKEKRQTHIIEKMLFMIELDKGNCATSKGIFKKICPSATPNICCADTLSMPFAEMKRHFKLDKFDIIVGNPPFNPPKTETGSSGNSIWQNFVMKSFFMLNDNGHLCFVHPPGWKKPTSEDFDPKKFADGNFKGQIRQGQVWQVLKDSGIFKFIYTNDQRSKSIGKEYLPFFPAVDYYLYQKGVEKISCDSKNIFFGSIIESSGINLNYNLEYLPNLITQQTQKILHKITSKKGDKPKFIRFRSGKGFSVDRSKGKYTYIYTYDKKSEPKFQYSDIIGDDNINMDKVIMNFDGGIDCYTIQYVKKEDQIGSYEMTMYSKVDSDEEGKQIERFFKSDIVKFIFLITQYASGKMTKNEPLVANSITIPPAGVADYFDFFGIKKYKAYIEKLLSHYDKFKEPKRVTKTEKVKKAKVPAKKAGGARTFFDKTRKRHRV